MSYRDDLLPLRHFGRTAERGGLEVLAIDADDGEIERPIRGVDLGDILSGAVAELDLQPTRVADDVQVRGDQPILAHHESCSKSFLPASAPDLRDGDDGRLG